MKNHLQKMFLFLTMPMSWIKWSMHW